jgi:hypothetical protein
MSHPIVQTPRRHLDLPIVLIGWPIVVAIGGFALINYMYPTFPNAASDPMLGVNLGRGIDILILDIGLIVLGLPSLIGGIILFIRRSKAYAKD